jgi:hypothetical protein
MIGMMNEEALVKLNELKSQLSSFEDLIGKITTKSEDIVNLSTELSDLESSKLHTALGFAISSLYFVALNLQGKDASSHPIVDDITRIKAMVQKINQIENSAHSDQML